MNYWLPLIYQFTVGGIIFAIGLLIPWRKGDYIWRRREDRLTLVAMISAFILYFGLQSLWTLIVLGNQ